MAEILIVDDERILREGLTTALQGEGFGIRTARNGEEALAKIAERCPDLVLLDVMMPKMNGFRCCEEIRRSHPLLPVVFLTAKESEVDQIRGIGLGADDYISKTASQAILLARIKRALERIRQLDGLPRVSDSNTIRIGTTVVNLQDYTVTDGGKTTDCLTKTEAEILQFFNSRRGELLSVDEIIAALRGVGFACEDSMLYVHVCHLRRKLGSAGESIVTRRGFGYGLLA